MNTRSRRRQAGRVNGLVLFAGTVVVLLLVIVVGANVFFSRRIPEVPNANSAGPGSPVAPPPAGRTASAPPTPEAAPPQVAADGQAHRTPVAFEPPPERDMPDGEYGKVVRFGEQVFLDTARAAPRYVGNDLSCGNCHVDAGRQPGSAPLWASFIHYPAYRNKTRQVDTLASRIQGCFQYSMNGKAPPADDPVITALQTYAFWLATGAPVGMPVQGSGYPKLAKPAQRPDHARGEQVYLRNCAVCHGADGQGQRAGDRQVFPPLWGPRSFNWGAGMHQLGDASAFIKANMPLGKGGTLSDQEAWDVAYFMNSHERPQDPRFTGSVQETRKRYHDTEDSLYGIEVNGHLLGSGTPGPAGSQR